MHGRDDVLPDMVGAIQTNGQILERKKAAVVAVAETLAGRAARSTYRIAAQ